jgi:hypothetical protein
VDASELVVRRGSGNHEVLDIHHAIGNEPLPQQPVLRHRKPVTRWERNLEEIGVVNEHALSRSDNRDLRSSRRVMRVDRIA